MTLVSSERMFFISQHGEKTLLHHDCKERRHLYHVLAAICASFHLVNERTIMFLFTSVRWENRCHSPFCLTKMLLHCLKEISPLHPNPVNAPNDFHLALILSYIEVVTVPVCPHHPPTPLLTRVPLGHAALREPAGPGPGHLQPRPQQELQAAGVDGAAQQRDQAHQQLHASGMMPGENRGLSLGGRACTKWQAGVLAQMLFVCVC